MDGAFFGLPGLTALFVFGGFLAALVACIAFALFFKPTSDRWLTLDDLLARRKGKSNQPEQSERK